VKENDIKRNSSTVSLALALDRASSASEQIASIGFHGKLGKSTIRRWVGTECHLSKCSVRQAMLCDARLKRHIEESE
jgi:hypothetical protein